MSKDNVKELLKPSFDYLRLLKNDVDVLRYHLGCKVKKDIEVGDINNTDDMLYTMLQVNNEFYNTDFVDNYKQDIIDSYISNIRKGHILVPGTYSVLFGNPYSMLQQSIGKFIGQSEIDESTIVCKHFEHGKSLVLTRSPHITMGNVMVANVNNEYEWMKYFNLSKNIVCVNSIGENTLQRLQSADFDSDTVALIDFDIIYNAAVKNYDNFLVPTTTIDGVKNPMYNNLICKAEIDILTDSDLIGRIVNCSQMGNSILWHKLNNGADYKEINDLYKDICTLSVASGLAIDAAKKTFPCNLESELERISTKFKYMLVNTFGYKKLNISDNDLQIINNNFGFEEYEIWDGFRNNFELEYALPILHDIGLSEQFIKQFHEIFKTYPNIRPMFFKYVADDKFVEQGNYTYKIFDTSMDYLQDCITKGTRDISNRGRKRGQKGNTNIALAKLINKNDGIKISGANRDQIDNTIIPKLEKYKSDSDNIWKSELLSSEDKYEQYRILKNEVEEDFRNIKISIYTMKKLINDVSEGKHASIARKLFSMIYTADKESFLRLFRENRDDVNRLVRASDGDIGLYDIKFKKKPTHYACKH